jgi:hypothetical protein
MISKEKIATTAAFAGEVELCRRSGALSKGAIGRMRTVAFLPAIAAALAYSSFAVVAAFF